MFSKLSIVIFIFVFSACVFAQQAENKSNEQVIDVNFCDLLKNPDEYKDKIIRVNATYRFSSEEAELFCSDCDNKGVWVEFTNKYSEESKKKYRKRLKGNDLIGKTINVVFVGNLLSGEGYGHFGVYPFKFMVQRLDYAEVIQKNGSHILSNEAKAKTYCQKKN